MNLDGLEIVALVLAAGVFCCGCAGGSLLVTLVFLVFG